MTMQIPKGGSNAPSIEHRASKATASFQAPYANWPDAAAFTWRLLRRMGVPTEEVPSVAHQALRRFSPHMAKGPSPRALLAAIRTALNQRRSIPHTARKRPADRSFDAEDAVDAPLRRSLDELLDQLSVEDREIFVLHEFEKASPEQIAAWSGRSIDAVLKRVTAAQQKLTALI